jgi:hypothetical protein
MRNKHLIYILSLVFLMFGFNSTSRAIISTTADLDSTAPTAQNVDRTSLPEAPTIIVAAALLVLPFGLCAFKSLTKSRVD